MTKAEKAVAESILSLREMVAIARMCLESMEQEDYKETLRFELKRGIENAVKILKPYE